MVLDLRTIVWWRMSRGMKYSRMKMRFQNYVYNSESAEESRDNKITNVVRIESSFGNRPQRFHPSQVSSKGIFCVK